MMLVDGRQQVQRGTVTVRWDPGQACGVASGCWWRGQGRTGGERRRLQARTRLWLAAPPHFLPIPPPPPSPLHGLLLSMKTTATTLCTLQKKRRGKEKGGGTQAGRGLSLICPRCDPSRNAHVVSRVLKRSNAQTLEQGRTRSQQTRLGPGQRASSAPG